MTPVPRPIEEELKRQIFTKASETVKDIVFRLTEANDHIAAQNYLGVLGALTNTCDRIQHVRGLMNVLHELSSPNKSNETTQQPKEG